MNKKIALVTLIEASIILSDEDRLMLLDLVPGLTEKQVDALGKFFALERKFVLSNEDDVKQKIESLLTGLDRQDTDTVYVGSGNAFDQGTK
ncbi:MAG: hypothetical protein ACOY3M_01225 [Patescibacteria group bacterium]